MTVIRTWRVDTARETLLLIGNMHSLAVVWNGWFFGCLGNVYFIEMVSEGMFRIEVFKSGFVS